MSRTTHPAKLPSPGASLWQSPSCVCWPVLPTGSQMKSRWQVTGVLVKKRRGRGEYLCYLQNLICWIIGDISACLYVCQDDIMLYDTVSV